jgi:hypothetical protein
VWPRRAGPLALLAVLYAGINALIPLQIDDTAYIYYARQTGTHPLDPYGFAILWFDLPQPANDVLAPPVLPYSIAPVVRLFGERPVLWKLALLPWTFLLTFALHAHLRRFATGLELELTAFLLFSPALLPSLNLMLDVPALALSLLAIHQFLQACATGSAGRAVLAGLVAAVAMQTKYTGVVAVAAMATATVVYCRPGLGLAAIATAALGFLAWEFLITILYGTSHFFNSLESSSSTLADKVTLIPLFFSQFGGLAPAVVLLGLTAAGLSRWWVIAAGAATVAGYAAVAMFDVRYSADAILSPRLFKVIGAAPAEIELAEIIFDAIATVGAVALLYAGRRLTAEPAGPGRSDTQFLLAWLGMEAVGYLVLTPFPAVRRVLGVFVVLTIVFGRLASRTCATPERRRLIRCVVAIGMILGLVFAAVGWLGARAYQRGAEESDAFVRSHGGGRVWYIGHWGFQYYAERCGMLPVVPRYNAAPHSVELPPPSRLRRGDWLAIPEGKLEKPNLDLAALPHEEAGQIVIGDPLPLRTVPCFYDGRTPLQHHERPRLIVHIYRVTGDCEVDLLPASNAGH